jgi:DNA-directed RNA polymerase subunit RPC12/RpoP
MAGARLSRTQRLLTWLAGPEGAAAMEAHSRAWVAECPACGHRRSIWELGGIRYKAAGRPRIGLRCPQCGKWGWHRLSKTPDFPSAPAPLWPAVRIVLAAALAVLVVAAATLGIVRMLSGSA